MAAINQNFTFLILIFLAYISVILTAPALSMREPAVDEIEAFSSAPLFEADIMGIDFAEGSLTAETLKENVGKNGILDENSRWLNRTIPYEFSTTYENDPVSRKFVLDAMKGFDSTCIRFVPRTNETDFLVILSGVTCSSYVGRSGGKQLVILTVGSCLKTPGIVQHELMHAIGFYHEQARVDRDNFVDINYGNIAESDKVQFLSYMNTTAFGEPYDFDSVMHYGQFDFAENLNVWTIKPKPEFADKKIGQRDWLSETDIRKINLMYKCPGTTVNIATAAPVPKPATSDALKTEITPFSISQPITKKVDKNTRTAVAVSLSTTSSTSTATSSSLDPVFDMPHRGCYYPGQSKLRDRISSANFTTDDVDPSLCTYIIVPYENIDENAVKLDEGPETEIFSKLNLLKTRNPNLKLFLSIGGKLSAALSKITNDPDKRKIFISSTVIYLRKWSLDGLDIYLDQNYAEENSIETFLPVLIYDLRSAFETESDVTGKQRLALSVVLHYVFIAAGIDGSRLDESIDIANVATYDLGTTVSDSKIISHHSPAFKGPFGAPSQQNMESILNKWASSGISKNKLVAGVPFYGRGWLLQDIDMFQLGSPAASRIPSSAYTKEPGVWPYHAICKRIKTDEATSKFDKEICASYAYTIIWWIGYNDEQSIREKVGWVRNNSFGGVYAWDISQDDFQNTCSTGKNPLLSAIRDASVYEAK